RRWRRSPHEGRSPAANHSLEPGGCSGILVRERGTSTMAHIVLNDEQMQVVTEAQQQVEVRDNQGNVVGYIQFRGFTSADLADAKRRLASDEPRYSTEQVLAYLKSLEPR